MVESKFSPVELISLLNNPALECEMVLGKIREFQEHEMLKARPVFGEYHHLFPVLKKYPDKFYQYMRMEISTFDYILKKVTPLCTKNWCNLHSRPIRVEERLVLTLR